MNAEQIDAIQARADAASQPPWRLANPRPDGRNMVERHGYDLYGGEVSEMIIVDTNPADAEFIASARTDVPALLALVREQQAQIERVEVLADKWQADFPSKARDIRAALTATEGAQSLACIEAEELAHAEWCNYPHQTGPCRVVRRLSDSPQA